MKFILDSIIYSYSQIFFSNRKWFGILALIATFVNPETGLLGLVGVLFSNIIAILLHFDKAKIKSGMYGFNGILIGAAASFYFELTPLLVFITLIFIIVTFFISTVLENYFAYSFNLPGLSLPFVLSLFVLMLFLRNYDDILYKGIHFTTYDYLSFLPEQVTSFFQSIGLILFQPDVITGFLLLFGILIFSRVHFLNAIISFSMNYIIVHLLFENPSTEILVISSFNAILTTFALSGSLIILSKKSIFLMIISNLMVVVFAGFFIKLLSFFVLPALVLPFNIVVLSTLYSLKFREDHSDFVLLYFMPGSPEENFYYHNVRSKRFERFKFKFAELPFYGERIVTQAFNGEHTHKGDWKNAWDFEMVDDKNLLYENEGNLVEDYFCYGLPVTAPLDGKVVNVVESIPDNDIGENNLENNWGNTIVIEHDDKLFSASSHLKKDSVKVKIGDEVKKGEIIGSVGNSGRSPFPHHHFQFQQTEKIGEKTLEFPIAQFVEKRDNEHFIHTFDFPEKDMIVTNIETHKLLKETFNFRLNDKFIIKFRIDEQEFEEEWNVKVNIFNTLYIESNNDAMAYFYPYEKIFYITDFTGNKKSALYHFYLVASKVPLGFIENLRWTDNFPLNKLCDGFIRYFSELFLIFGPQIRATVDRKYLIRDDETSNYIVQSDFKVKGEKLFSFFRFGFDGRLLINPKNGFEKFVVNLKDYKFETTEIIKE